MAAIISHEIQQLLKDDTHRDDEQNRNDKISVKTSIWPTKIYETVQGHLLGHSISIWV